MLIDTHCHINSMVKPEFDTLLMPSDFTAANHIIQEAAAKGVTQIINVGTSLIESTNCIELAKKFENVFAAVGIHPNDLNELWKDELKQLSTLLAHKEAYKIVAIGECGIDKHYPDYNLLRQVAAFKTQIELALEHDLALVIHSRDAPEETIRCLEEYKGQALKGTIHCFSEDLWFAREAISMGFVLGIGGTVTYPKNDRLRAVVSSVAIEHIILETDAPFLPPQNIRGKQNHPREIATIARYLSELLTVSFEFIASETTKNVKRVFRF